MKKIMFAGAEVMPFGATGGLGDVLGSLPAAIKAKCGDDADVSVVMPLYAAIKPQWREQMTLVKEFTVALAWRNQYCGVKMLEKDGVKFYFIDNEYYFGREKLYGYYDDGERFAFFSKAVIDMMAELDLYPDVFNANDWQTAAAVVYLKRMYASGYGYDHIKTVFTIHNIEYQGKYSPLTRGDLFGLRDEDEDYLFYDGCLNLMKGAIVCADKVSTVSLKYAEEILGEEKSHGLCHILRENQYKLTGILNGIDYSYYNPAEDECIVKNYTWRSFARKAENKAALQREVGLPERDVPMLAVISRLAAHKGLDLIRECIGRVLSSEDVQFVLLGTGEKEFEDFFRWLESAYPDKCRALLTYDRDLSKRIYAASDIFLMPSKSEPCGLSQMIASRYGSIPVTRETGGLFDSIKGYWVDEKGKVQGNGFTFANYSSEELLDRINAALALLRDPEQKKALVTKVMRTDFSWSVSADKYLEMYASL